MNSISLNSWAGKVLRTKTLRAPETCGYLLYTKGNYTASCQDEGIVPIVTGKGDLGETIPDEIIVNAVSKVICELPKHGALEFRARSAGKNIPFDYWRIHRNPDHRFLLITPKGYTLVYANPNARSGLAGRKYEWGSEPARTLFDEQLRKFNPSTNRIALAKCLIDCVDEEIEKEFLQRFYFQAQGVQR